MKKETVKKKFKPIHEEILRITRITVKSYKGVIHRLTCDGAIDDKRIQYSEDNTCLTQLYYSKQDNISVFAINVKTRFDIDPAESVKINFKLTDFEQATVLSLDKIWWTSPHFVKRQEDCPENTIAVFYKTTEGKHACLLTVPGNGFRSRIKGNTMTFSIGKKGRCLFGAGLFVAVADDPYTAVHNCFEYMNKSKNMRIPLVNKRTEYGNLRGFGWCTWDAFYHDVNEAGIIEKMEEFKAKNIVPSFVIIDDGWSPTPDNKITSFDADPAKFPDGLGATIAKIKSYGVKFVGVWHTLNIYWGGVKEGSPLFEEIKEHLVQVKDGMWIPKPTLSDSYAIYSEWYKRLKAQGVDFTKVDNQSSVPYYYEGFYPPNSVSHLHKGIDKAASDIFGADIINCMGHDPENTFNRLHSIINRNSDDFFPGWGVDGLVYHAMCNTYNSIYFGEMYITDYDMYWSEGETAKAAAILRGISGGPIYTSDKVGHSDIENIKPLLLPDGTALRCDHAGRPTLDCFYRDCPAEKYPLKIWNTLNGNYVYAVFNLTSENMTATISLKDIPGIEEGNYEILNYTTQETVETDTNGIINVTIKPYDAIPYIITKKDN